jgi:hypothetical protein
MTMASYRDSSKWIHCFLAGCLTILILVSSARGDVIYTFEGGGSLSVLSFEYESPGFVTTNVTIPATDLSSCTTFPAGFTSYTCSSVSFDQIYSLILFTSLQANTQQTLTHYFYFHPGDLATPGSYSTRGGNPGYLTVTESAAVPEPASVILLASGMTGFWLKKRRAKRAR